MNYARVAFIIRIWHEATPENPQIRGSVQLASSAEKAYFSSLEEIPNLLRKLGKIDNEIEGNEEGESKII